MQDPPPSLTHTTTALPLTKAAKLLSKFLTRTKKHPHLHPDSLLLAEGVKHGPKSGPNGGLALHNLRRIEAGLRGEDLGVETKEELRAQFGEEAVPLEAAPEYVAQANAELVLGDDRRLDEIIEDTQKHKQREVKEETAQEKRKREKKERKERDKAGKRKLEEAEAETGAVKEDAPPVVDEEAPRKKIKKEHTPFPEVPIKKESSPTPGPSTTVTKKKSKKEKVKIKKEEEDQEAKNEFSIVGDVPIKKEDVQSQREYELSQRELVGELGERDGAPVSRQDGAPPVVIKHESDGKVKVPSNPKSEAEKAERKAAKKARRAEEKKKGS